MMTRRQEHGGFDGVHLYSMCEWEQQSRCSGHLFKLIWMVDAHVAFVVLTITDGGSTCAQDT